LNYYSFIILLSIGFAVLLHRLATNRGQNPVVWAVLGFAFGPLAIPFLYLTGKKNHQ